MSGEAYPQARSLWYPLNRRERRQTDLDALEKKKVFQLLPRIGP